MTSTYYVEKLDISGGDVVFSNITNDLTVDVTAQATGAATLTVPDLGGTNHNVAPFLTSGGTPAVNKVVRMVDGVSTIQSASNVTLSDGDVFAGVVGVTALASNDLTITAASTQNVVVALDSGQNMTVTGGGVTIAEDLAVTGDATITGDLTVNGTTTSVNSTVVTIADNNLLLSSNYTTVAARAGGIAVNYLPTATATTSDTGGFATTTTLTVVSSTGMATPGDIILISGAATESNNGIYEVASATATVITIEGTPTHNFLQSAFTMDTADVTAVVTLITVAVLQAGTDGRWEVADGDNAASMTFVDLALVSELPSGTWTEVDISTTNATPDATTTIAVTADKSSTLEVVFSCKETSANNALNGKLIRPFYNNGGTATAMGAGSKDESRVGTTTGWSIATSGSGANMVITVTGASATTLEWRLLYRATESP
jgi:hypothetical protein